MKLRGIKYLKSQCEYYISVYGWNVREEEKYGGIQLTLKDEHMNTLLVASTHQYSMGHEDGYIEFLHGGLTEEEEKQAKDSIGCLAKSFDKYQAWTRVRYCMRNNTSVYKDD